MAYADVIAADAPIRYWRFEEASGAYHTTIGTDSATVIGTPSRPTPGMAGSSRAVGFPTTIDFVELGGIGTLPSSGKRNSFSWECWFKVPTLTPVTNASPNQSAFQLIGTDSQQGGYAIRSWSVQMQRITSGLGCVYFIVSIGSNIAITYWNTQRLDDEAWHHLVGTWDGANLKMYVDGALRLTDSSRTGSVNAATNKPVVGYLYPHSPYNANVFPGVIDEAAIYETVLTPAQILAHYNAGIAPANDLWVWNGTTEVPANVTVWNGTAEVAAEVSVT